MNQHYIEAGLVMRRSIRRFLLSQGFVFTEDKGWLDSVFYFKCTDEAYRQIALALQKLQNELDTLGKDKR